jgi:hypothetical protein
MSHSNTRKRSHVSSSSDQQDSKVIRLDDDESDSDDNKNNDAVDKGEAPSPSASHGISVYVPVIVRYDEETDSLLTLGAFTSQGAAIRSLVRHLRSIESLSDDEMWEFYKTYGEDADPKDVVANETGDHADLNDNKEDYVGFDEIDSDEDEDDEDEDYVPPDDSSQEGGDDGERDEGKQEFLADKAENMLVKFVMQLREAAVVTQLGALEECLNHGVQQLCEVFGYDDNDSVVRIDVHELNNNTDEADGIVLL